MLLVILDSKVGSVLRRGRWWRYSYLGLVLVVELTTKKK
jgi:hypothetical protein